MIMKMRKVRMVKSPKLICTKVCMSILGHSEGTVLNPVALGVLTLGHHVFDLGVEHVLNVGRVLRDLHLILLLQAQI